MTTPVKQAQSNNYAAPNTPIASIKRPKKNIVNSPAVSTPSRASQLPQINSPMHSATAVRRLGVENDGDEKENGEGGGNGWGGKLFSPVLNYFADETEGGSEAQAEEDIQRRAQEELALQQQLAAQQEIEEVQMEEQDQQEEEEDDLEEFNPYLFIKHLPPYETVRIPGKICLPPKDKGDDRISLVLDLDETLVHCTVEPIDDPDMVFPVSFGGVEYQVHVRKRPFLKEFLEAVCEKFEVIVFTASQKVYADSLLNRIDPEGRYIKHRMFRESCLPVEGNYLKDLHVLGRPLTSQVLVDNSPHAFGYQVDNGIPIESWFDDRKDRELLKLEEFLRTKLLGAKDVRPVVREQFATWNLVKNA
ncbi:hypothetical protein TrCOL_g3818 [Triparma columacea]|uniref:FCP1 homology domain-containing protein n=1 Tax=Triparma columacea TaxID=722753 RepID=A0A9W7GFD3_9STRA|nr:hypothetical protein TrCOL_g3818 [Triparma columacea]